MKRMILVVLGGAIIGGALVRVISFPIKPEPEVRRAIPVAEQWPGHEVRKAIPRAILVRKAIPRAILVKHDDDEWNEFEPVDQHKVERAIPAWQKDDEAVAFLPGRSDSIEDDEEPTYVVPVISMPSGSGTTFNRSGYSWSTVTPDYTGGYNVQTYGGGGISTSTVRPNYSGGYNRQTYGNGGISNSTITPNYIGGYNVQTYGNGGISNSTITPNYIGGYNVQTYGNGGISNSTITPNYIGGYNVQSYDY
jgi:hypothetical protein